MMNMFARHKLLCAAAACALSFQAANAMEHTILIMEDAYFPDITHVDPGDIVHFHNTTGSSQNIISANEDWELGPIPANGQLSITIEEAQETTYYNAGSQGEDSSYTVSGYLSFDDAPID